MERDTVEGFVEEKSLEASNAVNLTIVSGYGPILKRWIPLLISILFGNIVDDCKVHFEHLILQIFLKHLK